MQEELKDAVCFGNAVLIKELLEKGVDPTATDESSLAPLHWAVRTSSTAAVEALIVSELIDLDQPDEDGNTALHMAAERSQEKIMQMLIEAGSDPNAKNSRRKKPSDLIPKNLQVKYAEWIKLRAAKVKVEMQQAHAAQKAEKKNERKLKSLPVDLQGARDEIEKLQSELESKKKQLLDRENELLLREKDISAKQFKLEDVNKRERELEDSLKKFKLDQDELRKLVEKHSADGFSNAIPIVSFKSLKIEKKIGEGGFATIHKGKWRGVEVAIKQLIPESESKSRSITEADLNDFFFRELRILTQVRHKNVVMLMAACLQPENRCFVLELCKGDLMSVLQNPALDLPIQRRVKMALDAAYGFYFLTASGLIHRDVKSANLLVDDAYCVKVTDFGYCTATKEGHAWNFTGHNLVVNANKGTPAYMAPECFKNESYSERSDVFSFGVVMWELMTRKIPWDYRDPTGIYAEVTTGNRLKIPEDTRFPPEYVRLTQKCWLENPQDRPTFSELVRELKAINKTLPARK